MFARGKHYRKNRDHCYFTGKYRGTVHSICNLRFNVAKETLVFFHNGLNYNYHLIIKELANKFERQFGYIGEISEKYKTFFVPIEEDVTKIDKDGKESSVTISYKIKFIDSSRLSYLVNNFAEEIQIKVKIVILFWNIKVSRAIQ